VILKPLPAEGVFFEYGIIFARLRCLKNKHFALMYLVIFLVVAKLSPFVVTALIVGFYLSIIVDDLTKLITVVVKKPRWLSRTISNVAIFVLIAYSAVNFFPVVLREAQKVISQIERAVTQIGSLKMPSWVSALLSSLSASFAQSAAGFLNRIVGYVPSFITAAVLVIVTSFIASSLKKLVKEGVSYLFPDDPQDGKNFLRITYREFERFVGGQVLVAMFVGLFVGFGAFFFKIPSAFFLGVLAFITDFVPYLGVVISAIPLLMLSFTTHGLVGLLIGIVILVAANQLEMWFLAPRIQSGALRIHWFIILLTILLFADLFSLGGILIALPFLIFLKNYWKFYVIKRAG